jgi:hypothetical protein
MEGLSSAAIDPGCFLVSNKGKALRVLFEAYEEFLEENRLLDESGPITMACNALETGKASSSQKVVMILSDLALSGVDNLLRLARGGADSSRQERVPGLRYPKRFSGNDWRRT